MKNTRRMMTVVAVLVAVGLVLFGCPNSAGGGSPSSDTGGGINQFCLEH